MYRQLITIVGVLLVSVPPLKAQDAYSLIKSGRLDRARQVLSETSTASLRQGNRLYFLSLLEPSADKSAQLMRAALNASVAPSFREEIHVRLAQYSLMKGDLPELDSLVTSYLALWEGGRYRGEMLRMSVLVDEMSGAHESAIRQTDRYLLEYSEGAVAQWGLIDKARVMTNYRKDIGAAKLLRKLAREKSGPGVPQALYMLAVDAAAGRNIDDAVFYYNIMREEFPAAVGLGAIVDRMAGMSEGDTDDAAAEKLTGTFYSVQVGVFSEPGNAQRQAEAFAVYSRDVEIKKKIISDKEYRVVYVGRFETYLDALTFRRMLEDKHKEVFQVVAR